MDLAGSERFSQTGAEGIRLKEGGHINKSLLTLATCIQKLSERNDKTDRHIPYRDSKLTRILQNGIFQYTTLNLHYFTIAIHVFLIDH